jgi:hypothetical protein
MSISGARSHSVRFLPGMFRGALVEPGNRGVDLRF